MYWFLLFFFNYILVSTSLSMAEIASSCFFFFCLFFVFGQDGPHIHISTIFQPWSQFLAFGLHNVLSAGSIDWLQSGTPRCKNSQKIIIIQACHRDYNCEKVFVHCQLFVIILILCESYWMGCKKWNTSCLCVSSYSLQAFCSLYDVYQLWSMFLWRTQPSS